MNWEGKRVLVTGAGGFIGSHLAEHLVELGADVRAFIHYNSQNRWGWLDQSPHRRGIEVVLGDITDVGSVRGGMADRDVVFHLAALIAIPYSYRAAASYVRTNVEGTLNVLQAARELSTERVIHTSTSEVYGTAKYLPMDEAHPLQAQSPYAASKIAADKVAEAFNLSFEVPVTTVRPFNTFGPRQSERAIIPTIISQCLAGARTIRLGNLHPTRDFNYVANTVEGFVRAASVPGALSETINLGSGREISIRDLSQTIAEVVGVEVDIETDAQRRRPDKSEVDRLLADNSKAQYLLGWQPRVSLEEGLAHTVEWMREHLQQFRPEQYVV